MKLIPLAALAALLAAGPALAQTKAAPAPGTPSPPPGAGAPQQPNMPDPLTRDFRACMQKVQEAAQTAKAQPDAAAALTCFTAENKRQEAKLSGGLARASKAMSAADKKRLDDANVAWRRFRDADCMFLADPKGSPSEAAGNAQCVLDRTIRRALDIDGLANTVEADKSGAPPPPSAPPPAPAK